MKLAGDLGMQARDIASMSAKMKWGFKWTKRISCWSLAFNIKQYPVLGENGQEIT
jgi:hypothetical protein